MREVHIYGPQFTPWFRELAESQKKLIGYAIERVATLKDWPQNSFMQNPDYSKLTLLPVVYDPESEDKTYTLIGFCPLDKDSRFVIVMGCEHNWDQLSPRCLAIAEELRRLYLDRQTL
ncbi:MAG: hypothetical protein AB8H47_19735 [Bacteroidia bacterium]